jgi:hypothetical protein
VAAFKRRKCPEAFHARDCSAQEQLRGGLFLSLHCVGAAPVEIQQLGVSMAFVRRCPENLHRRSCLAVAGCRGDEFIMSSDILLRLE